MDARDDESRRWFGAGSSEPAPTWCIEVERTVVGWVDLDGDEPWLLPGEGNLGYCVFPAIVAGATPLERSASSDQSRSKVSCLGRSS